MSTLQDAIRSYWPIATTLVTLVIAVAGLFFRVAAIEGRQDRQGTTLTALQAQVTELANDVSGMKATIESISDNVNYIRNRIDRVTQ